MLKIPQRNVFETDHWLLIVVELLRDKDAEDCFFFLQRSLWKELSFYLTSDVLRPTLGLLRLMFMTPWRLAGKEILHTAQGGGGGVAIAGEKDCTNIWRVRCIHPGWARPARKPHHPLVPPPTSGLPSPVPVRRSPASSHSQRCSRASCETAGTLRSERQQLEESRLIVSSSPIPTLMFAIPRLLLMNDSCIDCGKKQISGRTSQEPHAACTLPSMRYFSMRSISE